MVIYDFVSNSKLLLIIFSVILLSKILQLKEITIFEKCHVRSCSKVPPTLQTLHNCKFSFYNKVFSVKPLFIGLVCIFESKVIVIGLAQLCSYPTYFFSCRLYQLFSVLKICIAYLIVTRSSNPCYPWNNNCSVMYKIIIILIKDTSKKLLLYIIYLYFIEKKFPSRKELAHLSLLKCIQFIVSCISHQFNKLLSQNKFIAILFLK